MPHTERVKVTGLRSTWHTGANKVNSYVIFTLSYSVPEIGRFGFLIIGMLQKDEQY